MREDWRTASILRTRLTYLLPLVAERCLSNAEINQPESLDELEQLFDA